MDDPDTVAVRGTEGADAVFFSPGGEAIGLVDDNAVARIPVAGGRPQPLATVKSEIFGATWLEDGRIAVGTIDGGLYALPENGGTAEALALSFVINWFDVLKDIR